MRKGWKTNYQSTDRNTGIVKSCLKIFNHTHFWLFFYWTFLITIWVNLSNWLICTRSKSTLPKNIEIYVKPFRSCFHFLHRPRILSEAEPSKIQAPIDRRIWIGLKKALKVAIQASNGQEYINNYEDVAQTCELPSFSMT